MSLVDIVDDIQCKMSTTSKHGNFSSFEKKYRALCKAGLIKKKGPKLASLDEVYRNTSNTYLKSR